MTTTAPTDVALGVLERPHNAIHDQLLVLWRDLEEGAEAVCVHRLQESEELQPVLREVLRSNDRVMERGIKRIAPNETEWEMRTVEQFLDSGTSAAQFYMQINIGGKKIANCDTLDFVVGGKRPDRASLVGVDMFLLSSQVYLKP